MLNVSLGNRVSWIGDGRELEQIAPYFQFRLPGYQFTPAYRNKKWDGYVKYLNNGQVPTGLFLTYRRLIEEEEGVRFRLYDERVRPKYNAAVLQELLEGRTKAFDYQIEAVQTMVRKSKTGGIILSATGSGKTFLAGQYFRVHKGRGLFIVDERLLLQQAREELEAAMGERVGIIGDQQYQLRRVNVGTVQTLDLLIGSERGKAVAESKELVMVFDELHLMLNKRSFDVANWYAPVASFGLTATLELSKPAVQIQAAALCGPVIYRYDYKRGRADKRLAGGIVMGVDIVRDVLPREPDEEYASYYRHCIVNSKRRNRAIVDLVKEGVKRGKYIIVLVERVAHVTRLAKRLEGLPVDIVFGKRKTNERARSKARFEAGALRVIIANKVFKKGINLKRCDVIIDAAGMKNRNDAQQKYGRGVRLFAQKRGLLYFDIGDRSLSGLEDQNTWQQGTQIRRKALADLGVTVKTRRWKRNAAASLFDAAEKALRKET